MERRRLGTFMRAALAGGLVVAGTVACGEDEKSKWDAPCTQAPGPGVEWAKCQLRGADLKGANLEGALIHNVDLSGADLTGANLTDASVANTEFEGAILFKANLTNALFSGGDVHLAKFCETIMPTGSIASGDC